MKADTLRRRAEICLRFAERVKDPDVARRLRLMAADYLAKFEEAERHDAPSGAPLPEQGPHAAEPNENLPGATPEAPKD